MQAFTPDLNNLLTNLGPFNSASKKGLPAFERVLSSLTPLLGNVTPPLRNFEPFLKFTGEYVPELQALFANATAATQAHDKNADTSNSRSSTICVPCRRSILKVSRSTASGSAPTAPTPTSSPKASGCWAKAGYRSSAPRRAPTRRRR